MYKYCSWALLASLCWCQIKGDSSWTPIIKGKQIAGSFADTPLQVKTTHITGDDVNFGIQLIRVDGQTGQNTQMTILLKFKLTKLNVNEYCRGTSNPKTVTSGGIWTFTLEENSLIVSFNGEQNVLYKYVDGDKMCTARGLKPTHARFLDGSEFLNYNNLFRGLQDTASQQFRILDFDCKKTSSQSMVCEMYADMIIYEKIKSAKTNKDKTSVNYQDKSFELKWQISTTVSVTVEMNSGIKIHKSLEVFYPNLEGYDNLATEASVSSQFLNDLKLADTTNTSPVVFTLNKDSENTTSYGIYKVVLYALTTSLPIEGWKVQLIDNLQGIKPESQDNAKNVNVDCKPGAVSSGKDTFTFICDINLAATEVTIYSDVKKRDALAEVVIVGKKWNEFPCSKGYYSTSGNHNLITDQDCKLCADGTFQEKTGQTSCTTCPNTDDKQVYYTKTLADKQADSCQQCENQMVINSLKNSCECPSGTEYAKEIGTEPSTCIPCAKGKHSPTKGTLCSECQDGYVASEEGTVTCTRCPSGTYAKSKTEACYPCEDGAVSLGGVVECDKCQLGYRASDKTSCVKCADGWESNTQQLDCVRCAVGYYKSGDMDKCGKCPAGTVAAIEGATSCNPCSVGKYAKSTSDTVIDQCLSCEKGYYQDETGQSECKKCPAGMFTDEVGQSSCKECLAGKYATSTSDTINDQCLSCEKGYYQDQTGQSECKKCPAGMFTDEVGQSSCKECLAGYKSDPPGGMGTTCIECELGTSQPLKSKDFCSPCPPATYTSNSASLRCEKCKLGTAWRDTKGCTVCGPGKYNDEVDNINGCKDCPVPMVTTEKGQTECKKCEPGTAWISSTECKICPAGRYNDDMDNKDGCKECDFNTISDQDGSTKCTECGSLEHAPKGTTKCEQCLGENPKDIKDQMKDTTDEKQWQKCIADIGLSCESQTFSSVYGQYQVPFLSVNQSIALPCKYDRVDESHPKEITFKCVKVSDTDTKVDDLEYGCIKTANSEKIDNLADEELTNTEKSEMLDEVMNEVKDAGIGDVKAVAHVIRSMTDVKSGETVTLSEDTTNNVLSAVSGLIGSDLESTSKEETAEICHKMMDQLKLIAKLTETENTIMASPNLAVMKVKHTKGSEDSPKKALTFSLPTSGESLSDLTTDETVENTKPVLVIDTSSQGKPGDEPIDMNVVLLTDDSFMPDPGVTALNKTGTDTEVIKNIWGNLKTENHNDSNKMPSFVNSMILEVTLENPPKGFELKLMMKPAVSPGKNSVQTLPDGRRVELRMECKSWDPESTKWVASGKTVYDRFNPSSVFCVYDHNTSFAVLMSAYEIDPAYLKAQSTLTQVLLCISIVGLLLTLILLLPSKALRSTRSAKINICFTTALLVASSLFVLQNLLVKADNSGPIKLHSMICAMYTMLQHYMWLVVFMWMAIEGVVMYMSLVQVFGTHISKYMVKFNTIAYGIPAIFPAIGYFGFTTSVTVGIGTIYEHNYMADNMCFIKPESMAFYVLFLGPLLIVISVNCVFFIMVLRVILKSRNNQKSETELVMRQFKAAVGVMVLLGTGWIFGVFMSVPSPVIQVPMQYVFILLNSSQGIFVFIFYIVLNTQVKKHWFNKLGLQEPSKSGNSTGGTNVTYNKTAVTSATNSNYINMSTITTDTKQNHSVIGNTSDEEHTYDTAAFPANTSRDILERNANI